MSHAAKEEKTFGVMAEFEDADALVAAADECRKAGFQKMDAFSPLPIHGMDEALGIRRTIVPWFVFFGGLTGCLLGYWLLSWTSSIDYPIRIAGRDYNSYIAWIPICFECTILCAAFSSGLSMLALNRLPEPYHPVFNVEQFRKHATQDGFFLCIESSDAKFDVKKTAEFLKGLKAQGVYEVAS